MDRVSISDVATASLSETVALRSLQSTLDLEHVSVNHYHLDPETRLPWGLHAHMDQEELFIVLDGSLTFETLSGTMTVEAGDTIKFDPGEYHVGTNPFETSATFLAIGAPPDSTDIRIPLPCPDCEEPALRLELSDEDGGLACPTCGTTVDGTCDVCGEAELEVRLGELADDLIDFCRACGRTIAIER